jgi:lipopolysaccharide export system ATP-binding protein
LLYPPRVPLLEARNLCKSFPRRGRVVNDVSYGVEPGEVVGLLGPNGAGKTTSFRMTVGMIKADAGTVNFLGNDITRQPMYRRARLGMGYLSQEPSIFRNLTVEDNLLAILETLPVDRRRRRELLESHLAELGLTKLRNSFARSLSGGERRRLEITRSLVTSPKLLLLDEPFAGVDPIAVNEIQENVLKLRERGIGILLTDHNVRETLTVTDRAYIIADGGIVAQGTSRELVNNEVVRRIYLGEKFHMPELESGDPESEEEGGGTRPDEGGASPPPGPDAPPPSPRA